MGSFRSASLNIPLGGNGTPEAGAPSCSAGPVNCLTPLPGFLSQSYVSNRLYCSDEGSESHLRKGVFVSVHTLRVEPIMVERVVALSPQSGNSEGDGC